MLKTKLIVPVVMLLQTVAAFAATAPELPQGLCRYAMPTTSVTKTVCGSGCDYRNDQLQQAIDDAQLGTTILLATRSNVHPIR